jgi:hypothetical protein
MAKINAKPQFELTERDLLEFCKNNSKMIYGTVKNASYFGKRVVVVNGGKTPTVLQVNPLFTVSVTPCVTIDSTAHPTFENFVTWLDTQIGV